MNDSLETFGQTARSHFDEMSFVKRILLLQLGVMKLSVVESKSNSMLNQMHCLSRVS